ncbi:hypothetical protein HY384_04540 [Candidatus Daviesbacteria bacterium]|nr:hypothetical protein [Candidatus Daviesbacteria bacterium]
MINLSINTAILISAAVAILTSLLYLREYFLRKKIYQSQRKISQIKLQKIAQLLAAAEEAETQVLAEGSFATKKLLAEFKIQLQNIVKDSQQSINSSQNQLIKFMERLQDTSARFEEASKISGEKRINELFERLESKISDFLIQTEQKTTSSIDLELKAARQLIETYRNAQLKLIDENIVAMMEQTLNLVLAKKLSLKDQLDLIYEALEKAKTEKFIV